MKQLLFFLLLLATYNCAHKIEQEEPQQDILSSFDERVELKDFTPAAEQENSATPSVAEKTSQEESTQEEANDEITEESRISNHAVTKVFTIFHL